MATQDLNYYIHDEASVFRFKLVGALTADGAGELERCWLTASSIFASKDRLVDISSLTELDEEGRRLLAKWHQDGVRFIAQSARARVFAESITGQATPALDTVSPSGKWLPYLLLLLALPVTSRAAELKTETAAAWDSYMQATMNRLHERTRSGKPFLNLDESPERALQVRSGEVLVSAVGPHSPIHVPGGLIHHWTGAAFIPDTSMAQVLAVVRDYGRYKEYYRPTVVDAKSLKQSGAEDAFSLVLMNDALLVKIALESEYIASYCQVDEKRWYSVSHTTRIQEIEDYGQPDAHRRAPEKGSGYIWRMAGVTKFEERDGGVYVELEGLVLSRDIPLSFRWLVDPIVRRVSRNSLAISLRQTEQAVRSAIELETRAAPMRKAASLHQR